MRCLILTPVLDVAPVILRQLEDTGEEPTVIGLVTRQHLHLLRNHPAIWRYRNSDVPLEVVIVLLKGSALCSWKDYKIY